MNREKPPFGLWGWMLDALVGIIAAVLFLVFLTEPQPVDPMIYLDAAMDPSAAIVEHRSARLGVVIPTWLVGLGFGYSEVTVYALPLLISVLLGVAISNLGRAIFGWWVGPIAALLALSGPFIFLFSTQLLPDIPSTALSMGSIAILYHATRRVEGQRALLYLLAGAAFGGAFLMRETVVLFLPGLVAVALLWRARWRGVFLVLMGTFVGPVVDLIGNTVIWGDPLARVESVFRRTATSGILSDAASEAAFAAQSNVFATFWLLPELLWESIHGRALLVGLVVYLVVICLPGFRKRELWSLPVWVFTAWVAFAVVATIRPESGTPVLRLILGRYWAPFVPAVALMAVGWIALVAPHITATAARRSLAIVGSIAALALMGTGIAHTMTVYPSWFMRFGADGYWQLREAFREVPDGASIHVPRGIDSLVRIYANDSMGRPVGEFELVVDDGTQPDPTAWYLFHSRGWMPKDNRDQTLPWPPEGYEVAAAQDTLRWVLYTADSADWIRSTTSEISSDGARLGWQARLITEEFWEDPMPLNDTVSLDGTRDMVIYDDANRYGLFDPEAQPIPGGSIVQVTIDLRLRSGIDGLDCQFFPLEQPGERINVRAVAMRYRQPFSGERSWLCRTPDSEGFFTVRPVLIIRGPAELDVEAASVVAHSQGN